VSLAFSAVAFLASAAVVAYLTDWFGFPIRPFAVLPVSALAAASPFIWQPGDDGETAETHWSETIPFLVIVSAVLAWLLWLARPSLLPPGSGPDLTHHLALIDFIERHWRLPHDPHLGAVLGEMVSYTPGAHILAALTGAWTRTDGLHTVYAVVAVTVALKTGLIFLIARRVIPRHTPRTALAVSAVLLLFLPLDYFIGSFAEASYLAQVVSELFAVAMWLAIVAWGGRPSAPAAAWIALFGVSTFLAWPVALGPLVLLASIVIAVRFDLPLAQRARDLALVTAPIALVAMLHSLGRTHAVGIVGVAGYVAYPRVEMFGWWFLVPAAVGVAASAFERRSRTVALLVVAIALQSSALLVVANRAGAARPYMALKMLYLAIYPLAVAGSVALARALAVAHRGGGNLSPSWSSPSGRSIARWALVAVLAVPTAQSLIGMPRPKPVISEPLFLAGAWARANLKPECVDYVVDDVNSSYWLHIAVLRNARAASRSIDDDTYEPEKERIRWVEPEGLPYAIAQDFDRLPRDVRANVDIVARFGPAAVIKRRGPATCAP
jgi:hypothetical protein